MSNRAQIVQKVLIRVGLFMCVVCDGYIVGHFSGMVAAQQAPNTDVPLTQEEMTWLASTSYLTPLFGFGLAAVISEKFGRKKSIVIVTVPVAVTWLMMFFGQDFTTFMIAKIIVGMCFGGVLSLCIICTAEYTAPDIRSCFLNMIVTGGASVGVAISHVLGILFHWRTVIILGLIPTLTSSIIPLFWVESPTWLASKGRFAECATAFTKLHGHGKCAQAELQLMIKLETHKQKAIGGASESLKLILKKIVTAMKQKYMWRITVLTLFLHLYRVATARLLVATFALTILQNLTGTSEILLFTFVADGCLVLGSFMSCILIGRMKMRTLMLYGGVIANIALIALSISVRYFNSPWTNCLLFGLFIIIVNAGPYPVLESLFGEIYPLELKTYCMFGLGIMGTISLFVSTKYTLALFDAIGYDGVFLMIAGLGFICLLYFWKYLPETKGRTLQEIELFFKNNRFDEIDNLLRDEELQVMI